MDVTEYFGVIVFALTHELGCLREISRYSSPVVFLRNMMRV